MLFRITVLWIIGLLTIVPYGIYHLFFHAQRDEYALLITLVLFWIFGFWGVVGPILSAVKIRQAFRALELAHSNELRKEILLNQDSQNVAIDLIASENHIPRFLAKKVYALALKKLTTSTADPTHPAHKQEK